jgi:biopolymer transport protein TolR
VALMSAQHNEVMAEINITPFTDVLLVLLIIFMLLAAIMTPPGFQKSLADSGKARPNTAIPPKTISVLINARGVIFIDDRRTDDAHIYSDMIAAKKHYGDRHVSLTADVKAPYSAVIRVLDAARVSGLEDVGFATS